MNVESDYTTAESEGEGRGDGEEGIKSFRELVTQTVQYDDERACCLEVREAKVVEKQRTGCAKLVWMCGWLLSVDVVLCGVREDDSRVGVEIG